VTAPRVGLDLASRAFLEAIESQGGPKIEELPVEEARALFLIVQSFPAKKLPAEIEDRSIPGGPNGQISIRIIRPRGKSEALPVVMYFHGGGFVLGDKESFDWVVREIANGAGAAVVFVDYSRAPEAKYPVAVEEAYAATNYVAEHGGDLNLDSSRIAVAGDSAGGNLAAVTAQLAKKRRGPKLVYQVLLNPATDLASESPSMRELGEGFFLTISTMKWFGKQYLSDPQQTIKPTASPLRASIEQLQGLPPALVITSEFDPLRDQGEAYAQKLSEAGVRVAGVRYLGTIHGFPVLNAMSEAPATQAVIAQTNEALRRAFTIRSEKGIAAS
jgi:acetyl esterase